MSAPVYGDTVVSGNAMVHLGNSYHYSLTDARDAIYGNTTPETLRAIVYDDSLRGAFVKIPFANVLTKSLKHDIEGKIESLQTHLTKVQNIEQKHVNDSQGREIFASVLNDAKVAHHMAVARSHLAKLTAVAHSTCTGRGQVACVDDFCDQVQRLEKQITARMSLDKAIGDIPAEDVPYIESDAAEAVSSDWSDSQTLLASPTLPFRDNSDDQQEYLYATQDLWRQLASILDSIQQLRKQSWIYAGRKVAFYGSVFTLIYLLEDLTTGFVSSPGESHRFLIFFKLLMSFVVTFLISNMVSATAKRWKKRERTVQLPNV